MCACFWPRGNEGLGAAVVYIHEARHEDGLDVKA